MELRRWLGSVCAAGLLAAGPIGCASSKTSASAEADESETATTSSAGTSKLETVREQSNRNERERKRVDEAIDDHLGELTACYLRGLLTTEEDEERPGGRLTLRWTIDSRGQPHDVRVAGDSLDDTGISKCVSAVLQEVRFRTPESRSVDVEYPFDFRRAERIDREGWYRRVHEAFREAWKPPEDLRIESEDDEDVAEAKREKLRRLARETFILIELSEQGKVESTRTLSRSDDETFRGSVDEALEKFGAEGEHRFPTPRGSKLRSLVQSNGLVLHQWMPPKKEEDETEESGAPSVGQRASE